VKTELCASTSATNIRQKILHPAVQAFKHRNGLNDASPPFANRLLVECLRHAVFKGYKAVDGITTDTLILSWGVLVDNLVYKHAKPDERFERVLEVTVKRNDRDEGALKDKNITLYGCFDKAVGRYSISPAMIVVLQSLMAGMFGDTFTTIGDAFEGATAKFLFVAAQVFCGRPVSELVDFVIGPKAIVGNNVANVCTRNVRTRLVRLRQCNDASAVWSGTSKADELHRNAFVEISPVNLPSADIVLHIPGAITLAVKCKDVTTAPAPKDIREAFSIMTCTPEDVERVQAATFEERALFSYPQQLVQLGAPVISIVYTSRTLFSVDGDDSSERFDAVGPNCILAQGIGEPAAVELPSNDALAPDNDNEEVVPNTGATGMPDVEDGSLCNEPANQWDILRLSSIRWNLLQFDFKRHVDGEMSFDIAVSERTMPNAAANNAARYESGSSRGFTIAAEAVAVVNRVAEHSERQSVPLESAPDALYKSRSKARRKCEETLSKSSVMPGANYDPRSRWSEEVSTKEHLRIVDSASENTKTLVSDKISKILGMLTATLVEVDLHLLGVFFFFSPLL
ncbi:Hypothetical protein, putative, partial [Bodo saltans]